MSKALSGGKAVIKGITGLNPITSFIQTIYDEYANQQWQYNSYF